ncbi:MAG TPA: DUF3078 domain-containing protein [Prolixibacteraceae bacterium]
MSLKKHYIALTISFLLFFQLASLAAGTTDSRDRKFRKSTSSQDSLSWSISYMKKIFNGSGKWFLTKESFHKPIRGVIDYAENDPVDTIVLRMNKILLPDSIRLIFSRKAENISNRKLVPGYLLSDEVEKQVENRRKAVADSIRNTFIQVPDTYLNERLALVSLIPFGDPNKMPVDLYHTFPAAFKNKFNKVWEKTRLPANVTPAEIDTLKSKLFVWTRQTYNDSILFFKRDSLMKQYREDLILQLSAEAVAKEKNSLAERNRECLNSYNETEIAKVNDSIRVALHYLTDRAADDSTLVSITNITGTQAKTWTANHPMTSMRIFLKNEQNDSIGVTLYNNGKGGLKAIIDDGVKFLRLSETQKKEITFVPKKPDSKLHKVVIRHIDPLPWRLLGTGTVGFTQTALSNWAKGGESSLSMLLISRYIANYSKKNIRWENSAEFRLGIFSSKTRGIEKNDDKLEFQSRVGYSAFKKWYYSFESNFRTQVARGYMYPDKVNPISAFMAPAYLTFSIGMDFKPTKRFSLFLSPLTSKTTFVLDTALINSSNFGLEPGKRRLWEAGAIVKMNWHYPIMEDIIYDTRAEIFNNYLYPFQKFNLNWEQTLVMQVTQHISTRIMTQVIYDYNVKFPITDDTGKVIDQKAKWQLSELFTVGFNYRF